MIWIGIVSIASIFQRSAGTKPAQTDTRVTFIVHGLRGFHLLDWVQNMRKIKNGLGEEVVAVDWDLAPRCQSTGTTSLPRCEVLPCALPDTEYRPIPYAAAGRLSERYGIKIGLFTGT